MGSHVLRQPRSRRRPGSGRRREQGLLFRNAGKGRNVELVTEKAIAAPANPRASEQGTARPGKTPHGGRSSAMEETDWARQNEALFAKEVGRLLDKQTAKNGALVLIAPPAFLGDLRKQLTPQVKAQVVREIAKDLAHAPTADIVRAPIAEA